MTSASLIQARIDKGNGSAARQTGNPYSHYRPSGTSNPIVSGNLFGTVNAVFTQDVGFKRVAKTKSDEFMGIYDGTTVQVGDYLVWQDRTFFVASQRQLLPYLAIDCERVISVLRPSTGGQAGLNGYSGTTSANLSALLSAWPASCAAGPKGEMGDMKLPDDVKAPWWVMRLPVTPGTIIKTNDIVTDDLDRRYTVSSAELTEYGWKLTARQNVS